MVIIESENKKTEGEGDRVKYIAIKGDQRYMIVPQATVKEDGTYQKTVVIFDPSKITTQSEDNNV